MFDRIEKGMYWDRAWTLVSGCTPCSPGCDHCWALRMEKRFRPNIPKKLHGLVQTYPERLDIPLWRKKPTVWAIWNDLFHEDVPDEPFIREAFWNMSQSGWHTFLFLTKRAKRMSGWAQGKPWPENVWPGVTVCNQQEADEKIPLLLQIPAAVRWVSIEPMLGPIDLYEHFAANIYANDEEQASHMINWLVLGGETGSGARPMHPDWVRSVRDQCQAAGVPFFFKQNGEWARWEPKLPVDKVVHLANDGCFGTSPGYVTRSGKIVVDSTTAPMVRVGRKAAGRLLDGQEWNELPEIK